MCVSLAITLVPVYLRDMKKAPPNVRIGNIKVRMNLGRSLKRVDSMICM